MNKRMKKKRALANRVDFLMSVVVKQGAAIVALETANHLQHEHIEDLGNQVAELKRLSSENPEMFDCLNNYAVMMFLEEHDTNDNQGFIDFLIPYYEKAKALVK